MVWYDKTAIANIFGLSELKKKHRVSFDSEKEDAFIVNMNNNTLSSILKDYTLTKCYMNTSKSKAT
jgi:hypothetical protein